MKPQYDAIGETAGKIYQILQGQGQKTFSTLQKDSKISDSALFNQAVGWLAREEKVSFSKKGKSWTLTLNENA